MKYSAVIFDLDGTILDTIADLKDALNFGLTQNNFEPRTLTEVERFIGNGVRKLIERSVPSGTAPEIQQKIYSDFTNYYKIHCTDKTKPYDGIISVLKSLKVRGKKLGVVTNKNDYATESLCQKHFASLFDVIVGLREGLPPKPNPAGLLEALDTLSCKNDAIYVGDSEVDLQTAKAAGLKCISVLWGTRTKSFLAEKGADIFASCPNDILDLVE